MKTRKELDQMTPEERFAAFQKAERRARLWLALSMVWTIAVIVALLLVLTHKL